MKNLIGLQLASKSQIIKQVAITIALIAVLVVIGIVLTKMGFNLHLNN